MTPETLEEIGYTLYGSTWKARLTEELDTNERTVRRWANGQNETPEWLPDALLKLAERRLAEIGVVIQNLRRGAY